jgi:hypothetical protein
MSKDNTVTRTIVSAAPGWYVATLCVVGFGEEDCFAYDAIVAWQITREGDPDHGYKVQVLPITLSGMQSNTFKKDWCIKAPDGMFLLDQEDDDEEVKGFFDQKEENEADALRFLRARQPTDEETNEKMEKFKEIFLKSALAASSPPADSNGD